MARPVEYSPRRTSPPRRRPSEPRGCRRPLVVLCRVMELLEQFRARYPFPLDDFQLEAIRAIEGGQSVIVSAPTGAGKTLVAEFAIHMALATGKRIAYTTPPKALSNQTLNDFTRAFAAEPVGILTAPCRSRTPSRTSPVRSTRSPRCGPGAPVWSAASRVGPMTAAAGTRAGWWTLAS